MSAIKYYWEDMTVGTVRQLGSVTISAEGARDFASKFDPQPFHVDEEAARRSIYGRLSVSGWHTCALAMRLMVDNLLSAAASMGSPGVENVRWLKPVYPGDTLRLEQTVVESRPLRSRPDTGLVRSISKMYNQDGEQVLQMEGYGMFRRRHSASAEEIARLAAKE